MDQLMNMDPKDVKDLMRTRADRLLGKILELNRSTKYHNMLDAIGLTSRLMELMSAKEQEKRSPVR